jgi:hypothetical protein
MVCFSAPHSLLRWRGPRKPKVGIQRRFKALLPAVPPGGHRPCQGGAGGAVGLMARCRKPIWHRRYTLPNRAHR